VLISSSLPLQGFEHDYKEHASIYHVLTVVIDDLEGLIDAFECLIVFPRGTMVTEPPFTKMHDPDYLDTMVRRGLLQRRDGGFDIHDLLLDVLSARLAADPDKRRECFRRLVKGYEASEFVVDAEDDYFYLHFIWACLEGKRDDAARRLMSDPRYCLNRFKKIRMTKIHDNFNSIPRLPDAAANKELELARNLFEDPAMRSQRLGHNDIFRQLILLSRTPE
jgi:hypothetical protein